MALAAYQTTIVDAEGNVVPNGRLRVRKMGAAQPLAALKSDRQGTTPASNPITADENGFVRFFVLGGAFEITPLNAAGSEMGVARQYVGIGTASEYDIDVLLAGQRPGVRAATTANITIATALNNGDTLDGVTLATDDLVLVKDQTDASENGIYVVDAVPARSTDFDTFDEHVGSLVAVSEGTVNEGSYWVCNASLGGTLDSTAIPYTKIVLGVGEDGEPGSSDVVGTSTTSLEIGMGSKAFTIVEADRGWGVGARLRAASDADPTDFMEGIVASYSGTALTLTVDLTGGSGTLDDWTINLAGEPGEDGADGDDGAPGISGASGLTRVRVVATANVDISTALENGDSLDGVTLATNDLVLLTAQADDEDNGVYVVPASGAASRHTDFDAYDDLPGTYFSVMEGTAKEDTLWRCTSDRGGTIDVTALVIEEASVGGGGGREILSANRTYYVRTDGSDSNDGLTDSSGGAFLTIQAAIDTVYTLDLAIYTVTIQVRTGSYTGTVRFTRPFLGGAVVLQGDTTTPSNVVINVAGIAIEASGKAIVSLQGFKMQTSSGAAAIRATDGGLISIIGNMEYGAVSNGHIECDNYGIVRITANYSITGGGIRHWWCEAMGLITCNGRTITITGTPAFSSEFCYSLGGYIFAALNTFSGSATGKRYTQNGNGTIQTNGGGATYLPGNSAGSVVAFAGYL